MRRIVVGERALALYNIDGTFFATSDLCTHRRARLSDGYLEGREVQCPLHFGRFDVPTGRPLNPPCIEPVDTFRVEVDAGYVFVDVPDAA